MKYIEINYISLLYKSSKNNEEVLFGNITFGTERTKITLGGLKREYSPLYIRKCKANGNEEYI